MYSARAARNRAGQDRRPEPEDLQLPGPERRWRHLMHDVGGEVDERQGHAVGNLCGTRGRHGGRPRDWQWHRAC